MTPSAEKIRKHRPDEESRKAENIPVTFLYGGRVRNAHLTNLSETGAHLLVVAADPVLAAIPLGAELLFDVQTPYGWSKCKAVVKWVEPGEEPHSFGVEFSALSPDASDSLRCVIDSPL